MIQSVGQETIATFVETCHQAARRGLLRCSSGNLSLRVNGDQLLVTATRSWLERLTPENLALCRMADGWRLEGAKPTVEIGFHAGILKVRPEVNVVLHFQTPCATTLACLAVAEIDFFVLPEIPFYIGPVARVPFLPPGSPELAAAVVDALRDHDLALLANHGQVTVAHDLDQAIQNAVFFELACEIILRAGDRVSPLPAAAVTALLEARKTNHAKV